MGRWERFCSELSLRKAMACERVLGHWWKTEFHFCCGARSRTCRICGLAEYPGKAPEGLRMVASSTTGPPTYVIRWDVKGQRY